MPPSFFIPKSQSSLGGIFKQQTPMFNINVFFEKALAVGRKWSRNKNGKCFII